MARIRCVGSAVLDLVFTVPHHPAEDEERGIRKKYIINARLEIAQHPEVLGKMEKAGFFLLMLGIESTQTKRFTP